MSKQQKQQLRQEVLPKCRLLTPAFVQAASQDLTKQLQELPVWQSRQTVHIYLPIEEAREVDTWPVVDWLLENGHEIWASYLPKDDSQDGFCRITKTTKYDRGRYDIPLPQEKVVSSCEPDVIIAACVVADKNGNRLGHGNGWTDRFFAAHPTALKIGLVYNQFLFDKIPHEPHDQKLELVVTETKCLHTAFILDRNRF